jgi:hypothetical protein
MAQINAIMKEPTAREPKWYLKIHQYPVLTGLIDFVTAFSSFF